MNPGRWVLVGIVVCGAAALWGCGDAPQDSTRLNRSLGSGVSGAPVSIGNIDQSILADPANYTPTPVDSFSLNGSGAVSGAPDEGPEAKKVRALVNDVFTALLAGDVDGVLDGFPDEQVAALKDGEFSSTALDLVDAIDSFWRVLTEKVEDTDAAGVLAVADLLPLLKDLMVGSSKVELTSETEAALRGDPGRVQLAAEALKDQIVPVLEQMLGAMPAGVGALLGGSGLPSASELFDTGVVPAFSSPTVGNISKVDGEWKFVLPLVITEEHADGWNEAFLILLEIVQDLTDQIDALDALTQQELAPLVATWADTMNTRFHEVEQELEAFKQDLEAAVAAAAGEGGAGDQSSASGSSPGGGAPVSFTNDVMPIFSANCVVCHSPGGRAADRTALDLSPGAAYANIVNGPSSTDGSLTFVVPGDVSASYLYEKLASSSPAHGWQMPLSKTPLSAADLKTIEDWILSGALDDSPPASAPDDRDSRSNPRVSP